MATAGVLLVWVLAISWLSVCLGLLANSAEAASGFTFFVLFLPYLSSAFVPTDTMPAALRAIADHQPITPTIETVRGPHRNTGRVERLAGTGLVRQPAAGLLPYGLGTVPPPLRALTGLEADPED